MSLLSATANLWSFINTQAIRVSRQGHRGDRSGGAFVLEEALEALRPAMEFRRNKLTNEPELWVFPRLQKDPLKISRGPGYLAPWLPPTIQTDQTYGDSDDAVPRLVNAAAFHEAKTAALADMAGASGTPTARALPCTSVYLCQNATVYTIAEPVLASIGADIATTVADFRFSKADVTAAWEAALETNTYNPVALFLQSAADTLVKRHGKPVIQFTPEEMAPYRATVGKFLSKYLHAPHHPVSEIISRVMLLSAVMRNYDGAFRSHHPSKHTRPTGPGTDSRNMVVLYGPQNQGKSSAITYLSPLPAWAVRVTVDLNDIKTTGERVALGWLVELQEIDQQLKGRHASRMKEFLTNPELAFRDAYARRARKHPLSCIYIGTTNRDDVLADITAPGLERTLIITVCQKEDGSEIRADFDGIRYDRSAIWEAAVACFLYGDAWDVTKEEEEIVSEHQQHYKKRARFPRVSEEAFRAVLEQVDATDQIPLDLVCDKLIDLVNARGRETMRTGEAEVEIRRFAAQRRWPVRRMTANAKLMRLLGMGPREKRKVLVVDVGDDLNVKPEEERF